MNYFIFQSIPGQFNFPLNIREQQAFPWLASRFYGHMAPGDVVFYWIGGPSNIRGIYGWGHITAPPIQAKPGDPHNVQVYCDKLLSQHIGIEQIRRNPKLSNLMILKLPLGTNFQINHDEARSLAAMMQAHERPKIES